MVTMREVAARAGVSHATVSYILNNKTQGVSISSETRSRVLRLAEEMGYRVNSGAKVFRSGKFNCAALLLSTQEYRSNLPGYLWDGIHDTLAEHDYHLTVSKLPDEKLTDAGTVPKVLRELMADGLLIDYTDHIPQRMIDLIRGHQLPAIWINSKQESDCVYPDDYKAAKSATEYLLKLGHKRVVYVDYLHWKNEDDQHYSAGDRRAGYADVMSGAGLMPQYIGDASVPHRDRFQHLKSYLCVEQRPTALLCYSPTEDVSLAFLASAACGLEVPDDLSIISFESTHVAFGGKSLTVFQTPDYKVGQRAVSQLFHKMEDATRTLAPETIPFVFLEGDTCSAPSK